MKKQQRILICLAMIVSIMFMMKICMAENTAVNGLNWDESYAELKQMYGKSLYYNTYHDNEDCNSYWLKLPGKNVVIQDKAVLDGKILLYLKDNKLCRIKVDFIDGSSLIQKSPAFFMDEQSFANIAETKLYWGAGIKEVQRYYQLNYDGHCKAENAPRYFMELTDDYLAGKKLKSRRVLAYFWHDQLYKITATLADGKEISLSDARLMAKAKEQGERDELISKRDKFVEIINQEIESERRTKIKSK